MPFASAFTRLMAIIGLLTISACASSGQYMGIDISAASSAALNDPERAQAIDRRNLIMLIAMLEGCYERVPGGVKPVRAIHARSFECAEKLAAVENMSMELGLGRGPSGIEALNLVSLAQMAQRGDKQAQFELGIRFEQGMGVEQNLRNACKLYNRAATQSGGTIWVYSPPVGNGTSGRVIPINQGPIVPGLNAAAERRAEVC